MKKSNTVKSYIAADGTRVTVLAYIAPRHASSRLTAAPRGTRRANGVFTRGRA